jgi:hypothetical protein
MSDTVDTDALQQKALKILEGLLDNSASLLADKGGAKTVLEISEHLRRLNADLKGAKIKETLKKMSDAEFEKLEAEAGLDS